jgi:hypothetical protein
MARCLRRRTGEKVDVPLNVDVSCPEGPFGRSTTVIINPITSQVTHVVVKHKGVEYMVPLEMIVESTPNHILLRCGQMNIDQLVVFDRLKFIPRAPELVLGDDNWSGVGLWPYRPLRDAPEGSSQLPHDQLCIDRGAHVRATDGDIGRVDEFLVDPVNSNITHLVLLGGAFWGRREITVPVSEIERIEQDNVYLKLSKSEVKALPSAESGPRFWEYRPR